MFRSSCRDHLLSTDHELIPTMSKRPCAVCVCVCVCVGGAGVQSIHSYCLAIRRRSNSWPNCKHRAVWKHCNSLINFFLWGANVFTLDGNEHYFRCRNRALPQDSHSLRSSTRDLWTLANDDRTFFLPRSNGSFPVGRKRAKKPLLGLFLKTCFQLSLPLTVLIQKSQITVLLHARI
jgi:hypothetical protein